MALSTKIVNFVRLGFLNDPNEITGVRQVPVVQNHILIIDVWILIDVINALCIEGTSAALNAVNDIPLLKEQFR